MLSIISRGIHRLTWLAELLAEIGLIGLLLIVFHEVIVRYVFDSPTLFSVELSEYLLVLVVFMSIGWVLKEDRHVSVTFVVDLLPEKMRLGLKLLTSLLTMAFLGILVWKGGRTTLTAYTGNYHSSSLLDFPMWIPYSLIPLGALVLSLQYIVKIGEVIQSLTETKSGSSPPEG
jgi:TRAP-type C4-dicarboxylate transport system permease small subunit